MTSLHRMRPPVPVPPVQFQMLNSWLGVSDGLAWACSSAPRVALNANTWMPSWP